MSYTHIVYMTLDAPKMNTTFEIKLETLNQKAMSGQYKLAWIMGQKRALSLCGPSLP